MSNHSSSETRAQISQDMGAFKANRRVRISQEALVGEAYKQRRLAHRRIACKIIASSLSFFETAGIHRLNRLASDDELENIVPCYTSHDIAVVRADGNCREPEPASFASRLTAPHVSDPKSGMPSSVNPLLALHGWLTE